MALRLSTGVRNKMLGIALNKFAGDDAIFESGVGNWTGSTASLASAAGGQAGNCLQVTGSGGAGYAYATADLKNGHTYYFSGYFKQGSGTSGRIEIGTSQGGAELYDSGALTDTGWTQYEAYFMVPGAVGGTTTVYFNLNTDADAVTQLYDTLVLRNTAKSVQDIFKGGQFMFYTGVQPTSPDDAPTGTLLCTIKAGANGITFDDAAAGVLSKAAAETWSGVCGNNGTAGWARMVASDDGGASSTIEERLDMAVATSGGQLNMTSTSFASGATETMTSFTVTLPAA